jgi:hypothetical protein
MGNSTAKDKHDGQAGASSKVFSDGEKENGRLEWIEGDVYEGGFKDDKYDGSGLYTRAGNTYCCTWKNGKQNGPGTMVCKYDCDNEVADKGIYIGDWKNGLFHGVGKMSYIGHNEYKVHDGEWKGDKFGGLGTLEFVDGRTYKGGIKNDVMDGEGTLINEDGSEQEGVFKKNKLVVDIDVLTGEMTSGIHAVKNIDDAVSKRAHII